MNQDGSKIVDHSWVGDCGKVLVDSKKWSSHTGLSIN